MWYIYTTEYLVIKRNEVLIHAVTQNSLENNMLSEHTSLKGPHIAWLHVYEIFRGGDWWLPIVGGRVGEKWGLNANGYWGSFEGWKCSNIDYDGCTTVWIY